jgi:integrase
MRSGELVHLLIEDLDFDKAILHVRGKPELGWSVKTGHERRIPMVPELSFVLKKTIGSRTSGVVFLREKIMAKGTIALCGNLRHLVTAAQERLKAARSKGNCNLDRKEEARILRSIWRDAGAIDEDRVRSTFIRAAKTVGLSASCPKSWRHTFATLLQEANVDLLIRQQTLGHSTSAPDKSALGMTTVYTHTNFETMRREIDRALRLRSRSLIIPATFYESDTLTST